MDMSRFLLRRIAAVSAAILLVAIAFALWRAQFDVEHESRGATEVVRAFAHLAALQDEPVANFDRHLGALRAIVESGRMRHLQLRLTDAEGNALITAPTRASDSWIARAFVALLPASPSPVEATTWTIRNGDTPYFIATFTLDPASEQQEGLEDTLGLLGMLAACVAMTLLAAFWAVRRALLPLQPIHAAITRYRRADYAWRVPPLPMRELDAVGHSLNHMAGALAQAQDVRRNLSLKLLTLQEDERARIARELHDEFGQVLTAMRADAAWLLRRTATDADVQAVVRDIAAHCARIQGDVRELLRELRPQDIDAGGEAVPLRRLLGDLVQSWRERPGNAARITVDLALEDGAIGNERALALYRMTQEALTNTMRHALATRIDIRIGHDADGVLEWCIEDDGVGIEAGAGAMQRGNGLAGISERVWAHHGEITISDARAHAERPGVCLRARFREQTGVSDGAA